ncbi:Uu.00g080890.m01.CDS01 [Anthostomella pinea]|uniref:Uu.00g080890.m01.CDS01 n=1 Tax=Anthostomella pinea TaxID=933095 RepID=A0AAI8YJH5_9PEZI|nr:Uu.00g080890.m01.CDS01 [Anthostomella pinea]
MEAKAREREALVSKTSGKEALDHAVAAAELYMKAAKEAPQVADRKRLNKKCQDLILRAEGLKRAAQATDSVSHVERRLQLPRHVRQIPTSEKSLLYRNARLHGNTFPPWESDPDPADFTGGPFRDPSSFSLSARQEAVFAGWKRPLELFGDGVGSNENPNESCWMKAGHDYDLVQDITTDCSVVASLCASIKQLRPGPTSILPALMFPVESENGQPRISASGKYVFRMFFNGCFRRVVIDDCLPSSSNDRTLYVVDRQNPKLIWPALMEKAYLKVRGGYDFPGSNSGTDLCVLTGWIPQQLFLQSDDLDWNATWKRVKKAYDYGDVVVTLGTGHLSPDEEETMGLAGEHDYAVLDMSETPEDRRLLVKNPWCDGLVWKGIGSSSAKAPGEANDHPVKVKPGSFWISFDDVTQNFESLYLNWNPSLFTQRQDHHFTWQLPEANMAGSFAHNPQYSMTAQADGQTWILLSRHFQDAELEIARKRTTTLAAVSNMMGFMSLYIFTNNGERVQLSDKSIYRGPFVDSPETLAPFEAKKGVRYTIVVASQDLPLPSYSFTLSFFSRSTLTVVPAQHSLKHYTELKSSWTRRTCGGNSASPTYLTNPQFSITLPQPSFLSILLSTSRDDLPVHTDLVWARGRRVTAVTVRDLVATSGDYRRGCCALETLASAPVDAGVYTVVCSTFEPGHLADFTLRVGSDVPCTVAPVPPDAGGRLRAQLPPLAFRSGESNKKRASVSVDRLTRASVVLTRSISHHPNFSSHNRNSNIGSGSGIPRSHPTIRMTLESGRGPHREVLAATGPGGNGEFSEVGLGLRTPEFDIDPRRCGGGLWLVVEQMGVGPATAGGSAASAEGVGEGNGDGLQVEVFSDGRAVVGGWEVVDG